MWLVYCVLPISYNTLHLLFAQKLSPFLTLTFETKYSFKNLHSKRWSKSLMSVSVCRWNQLDLAIVLLSIMGITLEEIEVNASLPINPTIIRIMRVLRIARGMTLLHQSQSTVRLHSWCSIFRKSHKAATSLRRHLFAIFPWRAQDSKDTLWQ